MNSKYKKRGIPVICGLGTDVVAIERVRKAWEHHGDGFLRRILSPRECEEALTYPDVRRVEFLSGRFAAKEAMAKALACGIGRLGMPGVDIWLTSHGLRVRLDGPAKVHEKPGITWHVSISHTSSVALAVAICESVDGWLDE